MSQQQVDELLSLADQSGDHREKARLLEAAVRAADTVGDIEQSYSIRMMLIESAVWTDQHDRVLVAFSWCLAHFDQSNASLHSLLWRFKWVLQNASSLPAVSGEQIRLLEDDMQNRLDSGGYNRRSIEYIRMGNRASAGHHDAAREHHQRWKLTTRDAMSDCRACEHDGECQYFSNLGENDKALAIARDLVDGKLGGCAEVPERPYGRIMRPLLRLDLIEEAEVRHKAGIGLIAGKVQFVGWVAEHLLLLLRTAQQARTTRLINKHLRLAHETIDAYSKLDFFYVASLALESRKDRSVRLQLPTTHPRFDESSQYDARELADWYRSEATQLAEAFDARHRNTFYAERLQESRMLAGL